MYHNSLSHGLDVNVQHDVCDEASAAISFQNLCFSLLARSYVNVLIHAGLEKCYDFVLFFLLIFRLLLIQLKWTNRSWIDSHACPLPNCLGLLCTYTIGNPFSLFIPWGIWFADQ